MSKLNIESYLVFDSGTDLSRLKRRTEGGKTIHSYTLSGTVILPFHQAIPMIVRSSGCIGTARIDALIINETSTTVHFTPIETGGNYKPIYDLYRASVNESIGTDDSDDFYADTDQMVPGAIGAQRANRVSLPKRSKKSSGGFFGSINMDDFDD